MRLSLVAGAFLVAATISSGALALDAFTITYELPGVQTSTAGFDVVGIETFDELSNGVQNFVSSFGTGGVITAQYAGVQINSADQYGGAGGTGKYAVAFSNTPYSLKLSYDPVLVPNGINYFGYWLSALDSGNQVAFYKAGTLVGTLDPAGVIAAIGANPLYKGNPNAPFLGQNGNQPYAFLNFYDTTGTFDEVRFFESPAAGGYESDNHTVGFYNTIGGIGVPEPASWALMIAGFGMVGAATRRRRANTVAA